MAKKSEKVETKTVKMINLPSPYNGVPSGFRIVPAGIYREDAPELLGLGKYLVESFHAKVVGEAEVFVEEAEDEPEPKVETPKADE